MAERGAAGFGDVLRIAEFRSLWAADLLSVLGDQVARVALAVLVYARTSSAALTALTYALTFVPQVLGGVLLSGVADRYPRRRVMVTTDLLRAMLSGLMALPGLPLPVLWASLALLSMAAGPFKAAQLALIPQILTGDRYVSGMALRQVTDQTAQLVGFGAGGVLLTVVQPHVGLLINAATFVASALLVTVGIHSRPAARSATTDTQTQGKLSGTRRMVPWSLVALVV